MTYKTTELLKSELERELKQVRACVAFNEIPFASLPALDEAISAYLNRVGRDEESFRDALHATQENATRLLEDAQKQYALTAAACADNRENWNEIYRLRAELKDSDRERENIHAVLTNTRQKLHEAITDRDQLETNNANGCRAIIEMWDDLKAVRVELQAARENTRIALAQGQEYQNRMNAVDREFHLLSVANAAAGKELREANRLLAEVREKNKRLRQSTGKLKQDKGNAQANETRLRVVAAELRQKLSEARKSQPATPTQTKQESAPIGLRAAFSTHSGCNHVLFDRDIHAFCPSCGTHLYK